MDPEPLHEILRGGRNLGLGQRLLQLPNGRRARRGKHATDQGIHPSLVHPRPHAAGGHHARWRQLTDLGVHGLEFVIAVEREQVETQHPLGSQVALEEGVEDLQFAPVGQGCPLDPLDGAVLNQLGGVLVGQVDLDSLSLDGNERAARPLEHVVDELLRVADVVFAGDRAEALPPECLDERLDERGFGVRLAQLRRVFLGQEGFDLV
ncbi:MAG: hypothetical protein M3R02_10645 [Chloroflexota bacterium]|nr:hypothetical protein [Chloroflexota bacterium]